MILYCICIRTVIKYLQSPPPPKVLICKTIEDLTLRVCKSCVPFACKFPKIIHFVQILHKLFRSENNFYVSSYG